MSNKTVTSGKGLHKTDRSGNSMLRPSPNHGTLWLHTDDDDMVML